MCAGIRQEKAGVCCLAACRQLAWPAGASKSASRLEAGGNRHVSLSLAFEASLSISLVNLSKWGRASTVQQQHVREKQALACRHLYRHLLLKVAAADGSGMATTLKRQGKIFSKNGGDSDSGGRVMVEIVSLKKSETVRTGRAGSSLKKKRLSLRLSFSLYILLPLFSLLKNERVLYSL